MKTLAPRKDHAGSCFEAILEVASETKDPLSLLGLKRAWHEPYFTTLQKNNGE